MTNKRSMKISYDDFPSVKKFHLFHDERGFFSPMVLKDSWLQSNLSYNESPFVFRGLHYQEGSYAQSKTIQVVTGKIVDFIVDIRPESESFGEAESFFMNPGDCIEIPRGYAHGFLTLEPQTLVQYFVDNVYSPKHEGCIVWNSVESVANDIFQVASVDKLVINQKDREAESWEDFKTRVLPS
jgi:dTDP-4-dehydrorhamnose 3,5-epimerase